MRRIVLALTLSCASAMPAVAEPPETHEVLSYRPSGFWTSNAPAVGGAYRYRLLLLGVAVALATGLVMRRIVKNTKPPPAR